MIGKLDPIYSAVRANRFLASVVVFAIYRTSRTWSRKISSIVLSPSHSPLVWEVQGFQQALPCLAFTCNRRSFRVQKGSTGSLPVFAENTGSKKEGNVRAGKRRNKGKAGTKPNPKSQALETEDSLLFSKGVFASGEISNLLSSPEVAVLNSIHNATVKKLTISNSKDGQTVSYKVLVTLDVAPDAQPVPLTLPLSMSQQQSRNTTTSSRLKVGKKLQVRITDIETDSDEVINCALVLNSPSARRRQGESTSKDAMQQTSSARKSVADMVPYLGKMVSGRVISTTEYAAFLDIGCKNKNAILHKSRITRSARVNNVTDLIDVGQMLTVRLIDIDPDKGTMAVSMLSEKSEQYMKWRKQHRDVRSYRIAAREAISKSNENAETKNIANALLYRMNREEEDEAASEATEEDEILQGLWSII